VGSVTGDLTETVSRTGVATGDPTGEPDAPRLIVLIECTRPTHPALRVNLAGLDDLTVGRGGDRAVQRRAATAHLTVTDHEMSRRHFALRPSPAGWLAIDLGSKNGILVNGGAPANVPLRDGDVIEAGGTLFMFREDDGALDATGDRDLADELARPAALRTVSCTLEHRLDHLAKIARAGVPVLVRGETGTGKELIARAIHDASARRGPFLPINCGALPRNLIESELFGHKKGAFSGANEERDGLVRRASGGTLFLDEIAELPEESQVALLRVLQDGEVRPVGAIEPVKVDLRVVAATHQDIPARIADGRFRQDLYARLSGFEILLPPLRERREDTGALIASLLPRVAADPSRITLHRSVARALIRYPFPLNIRELEQALRSAVALADTGEIRLDHLPDAIRAYIPPVPGAMRPEDRVLRDRLLDLLRLHEGNVSAVARALGKAPIQIRRWCARMQIDLAQFRP
jgi:sigma-54 dependent transcriptional regulator, acetoin dehydrogenase operon transcriptional activator AcoR